MVPQLGRRQIRPQMSEVIVRIISNKIKMVRQAQHRLTAKRLLFDEDGEGMSPQGKVAK